MAILNALSAASKDEGAAVQVLFRPAQKNWFETGKTYIEDVQKGKKVKTGGAIISDYVTDIIRAPWEVPGMHEQSKEEVVLTNVKKEEIDAISNKMRYPGFETLIRIIACSAAKPRSEAIVGGIVSAFSQFDNPNCNGFKVNTFKDPKKLVVDYTFRFFPLKNTSTILQTPASSSVPTNSEAPKSRFISKKKTVVATCTSLVKPVWVNPSSSRILPSKICAMVKVSPLSIHTVTLLRHY